jgi:hypothetical protein
MGAQQDTGESGGFFNNLLTGIGNLPLSGIAQTGLSYAALDDVMDRLSSVGSGLATGAQRIGEEAAAGTAFRPFTVSTGFGGVTTTPEGGFTTSLSPAQAAQQQQLQAITSGLLGGMGGMGGGSAPIRPSYKPQFRTGNRDGTPQDRSSEFANLTPERLQKAEEERQKYLQERGGEDPLNLAGDIYNFVARQPGDIGYVTSGPVRPPTQLDPFMIPRGGREFDRARKSETGSTPPMMDASQYRRTDQPMAPVTGGFGSGIPDVSGITGQALGGLSGALTGLMAPMGQREADVYERIRATQRPEEERARLALEERLQSQGRTGLRTAQFGGAPEQLALAQAQEEAKARASLGALEQAQAEQMQQLGLAQGLFGLGSGAAALPASLQGAQLGNIGAAMGLQYLPEQQLLSSLTPAINLANIAGTGQRQGAGYLAEAGISGLESQAQTELARANLLGQIYSSMLGAAGATGAAEAGAGSTNDLIGSIFGGETLGGLFSSIFN